MKRFFFILLMMSLPISVFAETYESLDINFDDFISLANKGNKSPRVKVIINNLHNYDEFITSELKDSYIELLKHAEENEYRVIDGHNIPFLVSTISGCISHAISDLKTVEAKYLDSNHIREYALVMSCIGLIDQMENELSNMKSANYEYINANGFKSATRSMWAKSFDTKRRLLDENLRFLRHLIAENEN